MSNSSRELLRAKLRARLNDTQEENFDNAVLNTILKDNLNEYRLQYIECNPDDFQSSDGMTIPYAALADYQDISSDPDPGHLIWQVLAVRDVTNPTNRRRLIRCTSKKELQDIRDSVPSGQQIPTHYYFWTERSLLLSQDPYQFVGLAPLPTSARTLLVDYQPYDDDNSILFDADDDKTGLPDYVEACILLKSAIDCRLIEEKPDVSNEIKLLEKAEQKMVKRARRSLHREDSMEYDPNLID